LDLHLTEARASATEQSAVDDILGAPASGWDGGVRNVAVDSRVAFGGYEARSRRHLLLPALHAVQSHIGWVSPGALNYISVRLDVPPAEVHGVASFYGMFSLTEQPAVVAHVCDDIACLVRGAEKVCGELEKKLGPAGSRCLGGRATWKRSTCLGLCERAPAAVIAAAGENPRERVVAPADAGAIQSLMQDAVAGKLPAEPDVLNLKASVPQAGRLELRLLKRIGQADPGSVEA